MVPRAGDELDDRAEEQERAVEGQADVPPVLAEQPVQHLEPLQILISRRCMHAWLNSEQSSDGHMHTRTQDD